MNEPTIVWAFRPLAELGGAVGLVECDEDLAQRLIVADLVDDPRVGDKHLREIVSGAPQARPPAPERAGQGYETRVMLPQPPKRKPGRPRKTERTPP